MSAGRTGSGTMRGFTVPLTDGDAGMAPACVRNDSKILAAPVIVLIRGEVDQFEF